MSPVLQAFLAILGGFLAASGSFWVYLRHRFEHRDHIEKLILGLAHDKIIRLCLAYLEKGYIGQDEYADLIHYFWQPYCKLGGNGSADRVMRLVELLPLRPERREDAQGRAVSEKLETGAESVIDELKAGDTNLESSRHHKRRR